MMSILDGHALDMHIGLANCKWVNIIRIKVAKAVVDETVSGFVRAHGIKNVFYRRVFWKTPVVFSDWGRCYLLPIPEELARLRHTATYYVPLGEMPPLELLNCMRIRPHGFLFEVADETVAGSWRDDIRQD
jgi:hypothetical protein